MSKIRPSRRSSVPQFHGHINNQEDSIIFTKEEEGEQQLPFPDCLISRTPDGGFTSKAYRKPTATDRFLRFDSHHPLTVKRGLIKCLTTVFDRGIRKSGKTTHFQYLFCATITGDISFNVHPQHNSPLVGATVDHFDKTVL